MSAVRNLHDHEVGGRRLRIDLADSDPFLEGKTTQHGELVDSGETRAQWRERERSRNTDQAGEDDDKRSGPSSFLKALPPGVPLPAGSTALDSISTTLASIDPPQLTEVLAQMKVNVFAIYVLLKSNTSLSGVRNQPPGTGANTPGCAPAILVRSLPGALPSENC